MPRLPVRNPSLNIIAFVVAMLNGLAAWGAESDEADTELEAVLVTAQRTERISKGATGLNLDIKDTPQSISVVTEEQMQDFGADNVNDALRLATGINVEQWETNRTNYMSRGFDIVNTQVDGVGMPNGWGIVTGAIDAFGYEKLEVIRGANGLLTGVGNSSGTINFVRKRPTNDRRGQVNATAGSWNRRRMEADFSTPFTASGSWAGRVVGVWEDSDSYLRLLHDDRLFLYGVVDGQIGEHSTLTVGYSIQDANTDGNIWGGLPFSYSDGTQASFPRNATTAQDWTRWDTLNHNAFLELNQELAGDWALKATYNFRKYRDLSRLFYSWAETGLDPETNEGIVAYPGNYSDHAEAHLGEISTSGQFSAFGRQHEATLGIAASKTSTRSYARDSDPLEVVMPAFPYASDVVPEPTWSESQVYDSGDQWLRRAFGATRLTVTDRLKAILGFNYTWFRRAGENIYETEPYEQKQGKLSPYAGLTFDISDRLLAYASYSDIYQPQDQRDIDYHYLDPTRGVNLEVGLKADWFNRRLLTTLALFSSEQRGLSTLAGYTLPDFIYYYEGVDVDSKGIEFEATGNLGEHVELVFGFTALKLNGRDGEDSYTWTPRRTAHFSLSTRLPSLSQLRLGAGGRWQSAVRNFDDAQVAEIRQGPYAVLDAFAEWKVNEGLSVQVNADNVTDRKYIGSVYYVGYYGAPRNYSIGVNYRF